MGEDISDVIKLIPLLDNSNNIDPRGYVVRDLINAQAARIVELEKELERLSSAKSGNDKNNLSNIEYWENKCAELEAATVERDALITNAMKHYKNPNPNLDPFDLAMSAITAERNARNAADALWKELAAELASQPAPVTVQQAAVDALASYQQADEDGIMVLVSRQAIDECLPALRALSSTDRVGE